MLKSGKLALAILLASPLVAETIASQDAGTPIPVLRWERANDFSMGGYPVNGTSYDAARYAFAINRHLLHGAYKQYGSEPNLSLHGYSYKRNRWDVLAMWGLFGDEHNTKTGHPVSMEQYMPIYHSYIANGEGSGSNQAERQMSTWMFDVLGQVGQDHVTTPNPGGGSSVQTSMSFYDESRDRYYIWPDQLAGVSMWEKTTGTWEYNVSVTGTAHAGYSRSECVYNPNDRKVYCFGGATSGGSCANFTFSDKVTVFNPGTGTYGAWEGELTVAGGVKPPARMFMGFALSVRDNKFVMTGGRYCSGGAEASYNDTWVLDLNQATATWTDITSSLSQNYSWDVGQERVPDGRFTYDEDSNSFVMSLNDATVPLKTWILCISPCANLGRDTTTVEDISPPAGSLSRYPSGGATSANQSWSMYPGLAANGATLYATWTETGANSLPANQCSYRKPYAISMDTSGNPTNLFSTCDSINPEPSGTGNSESSTSGNPIWSAGGLWTFYEGSNNSGSMYSQIHAKKWTSGTTWSGGTVRAFPGNHFEGISSAVDSAGTPTVGFIHVTRAGGGATTDSSEAKVYTHNGSAWAQKGTDLNIEAASRVQSIAVADNAGAPAACWVESLWSTFFVVATTQRVHCKEWVTNAFVERGTGVSTAGAWAADVHALYFGGILHVAYTQRATPPANPRLYVKRWNSGTSVWDLVGGDVVQVRSYRNEFNPGDEGEFGWPTRPRLFIVGGILYCAFEQQVNPGEPNRVYLAKLNGSAWQTLGTANMDAINGSAAHVDAASFSSKPTLIWTEKRPSTLRQPYVSQLDETTMMWGALAPAAPDSPSATSLGGGTFRGGTIR